MNNEDVILHVIGSIFLYQNAHYRRYNQFKNGENSWENRYQTMKYEIKQTEKTKKQTKRKK